MKLEALFEPDDKIDPRILTLEKQIGAVFPEDCIAFLRQMNGASISEECEEDFTIQLKNGSNTDLAVIYGTGDWIYNAARLEFWLDNRPHPHSILVGHDSGGGHFWISLRPEDYGTVHFKDMDGLDDGQIAANWTEFLEL